MTVGFVSECLSSGTQHMLQALLLLSSQILGFRGGYAVRENMKSSYGEDTTAFMVQIVRPNSTSKRNMVMETKREACLTLLLAAVPTRYCTSVTLTGSGL